MPNGSISPVLCVIGVAGGLEVGPKGAEPTLELRSRFDLGTAPKSRGGSGSLSCTSPNIRKEAVVPEKESLWAPSIKSEYELLGGCLDGETIRFLLVPP